MAVRTTRYETANYLIQIGTSQLGIVTGNTQADVYQLLNKQTQLVEAEGLSLPESILYLLNREESFRESEAAFDLGSIPGAYDDANKVH